MANRVEVIKCANSSCNKELTKDMEIEYSQWVTEYFCSPDCATNFYFDYMSSAPVDLSDKEYLKEERLKIVKGKLCKVLDY